MSYRHIENLYRPEAQGILHFRTVWSTEKLHGTSTTVSWRDGGLHFHSGGETQTKFEALFNHEELATRFTEKGFPDVTIYGEAYGGKMQAQAWRYGPVLKFCAFEVQIENRWLSLPEAVEFCKHLGLEFVPYKEVSTDLEVLNAERDAPSEQAKRNGVVGDQPKEGVVLRPIIEFKDPYGHSIRVKHKRDEERETKTPRAVVDPSKLKVLTEANAVANEWVTPTRLQHVLDKLPQGLSIKDTGMVIKAMVEDVCREGSGEFVETKEVTGAIGKLAANLFHQHLKGAFK